MAESVAMRAFGRMVVAHPCVARQPPAGQLQCVATPGQQMQARAGADGRRIKHNDEPGRLSLSASHRDGQINYRGNADGGDRNKPLYLFILGYFHQQLMSISATHVTGGQNQWQLRGQLQA